MANGRAAALEPHDPLAGEPFLAIGEIAGRAASARILLAAALTLDDVEKIAGASIETADELSFDRASASLRARRRRRLGALTLAEQTLPIPQDDAATLALARGVLSLGVARLPWTKALKQRRDRVMFLRQAEGGPGRSCRTRRLPPIRLARAVPHRQDQARRDQRRRPCERARRDAALGSQSGVSTTMRRRISGRRPGPRRRSTTKPKAARRSRSGCRNCSGSTSIPRWPADAFRSPSHLLSPANRPIQITRDLPGFWRGSWAAVRSDLRGRYPRHFWPEHPAAAAPTARAKPRGT